MDKPANTNPVFLIGAPRSGTTWLQYMLGAHDLIATPQETNLFSKYLAPLWDTWAKDLRIDRNGRYKGLVACYTQEEFEDALRGIVSGAYRSVLAQKPGARILLEKEPAYSLHVPLITRLFPEARFVHMIRDGRDVVASLLAASRSWGKSWAPSKVEEAAAVWRDHVEAALEGQKLDDRYMQITFEQLLSDGPDTLASAFRFIGVDTSDEAVREICDRFSFSSVKETGGSNSSIVRAGEVLKRCGQTLNEPPGFFREGRAGGWKESLSATDCWYVDRVAGDMLGRLGYASPGWAPGGGRQEAVQTVRSLKRWTVRRLRRLVGLA